MSALSGTWSEVIYNNKADYTAVASTASEATLLAGTNEQPFIPAFYFMNAASTRRVVKLFASGVFSTTGTPTLTFQVRTSTTQGTSTLSGGSLGVSVAITSGSGVSNQYFELLLSLVCATPGMGTNNTTVISSGMVSSPAGFASPFSYALEPTTPPTATWTATFDGGLTQYLNLSMTWSASSASNTITLKKLILQGMN